MLRIFKEGLLAAHIVQVGYNMSFGSNGDTRLFGIGGPSTTGAILTRDRIR